jgi:phage-related minor tail protein
VDDVIRTSLEVGDNASAPLKSAEEAAREYAQATGGLTDAEKRLLAQMLATQKKLEDRARVTGLAADQIRALERGVKQQAAAEAAAAASAKEVTANAIDSGKAMERAAQGGRVLQYQLMDITTQLAGGTNPLVILAQQGPDVTMAFQAGGGAAATFRAAMAPLTGALSAGALILPPLALAVAAVGTAYAVTTNHMESLIPTSQVVNDLLREQGSVAGQLSGELENTAGQWAKFTERMAATASEIERINTGLVNVAAAMAKAEGDVTTQGGGKCGSKGKSFHVVSCFERNRGRAPLATTMQRACQKSEPDKKAQMTDF